MKNKLLESAYNWKLWDIWYLITGEVEKIKI